MRPVSTGDDRKLALIPWYAYSYGTMTADSTAKLPQARALARKGAGEEALQAYLDVLRIDPASVAALIGFGALAEANGYRDAACKAYQRAVQLDPANNPARIGLGNLLADNQAPEAARLQFLAALQADPGCAPAHHGLARVMIKLGEAGADQHLQAALGGRAVVPQPYLGEGSGVPLLLLVSAGSGNIRTRRWIDKHVFAVTAVYAEFYDPAQPLPPHALIMNAIGDADLCGTALANAERIVDGATVPVINHPSIVRATGRAEVARRLATVPGVRAPKVLQLPRLEISTAGLSLPLLLRSPGFHTGEHFIKIESQDAVAEAVATLPGDDLLAIEYLDARGADGMSRKYRVMFIAGVAYPLHLAISADWKVHYFSAGMATNAAFRDEEQRFLNDMAGVLGPRAMNALAEIEATLGLDYGGIDFAVAADGSVLLFEANATMVILPPEPASIWNYRRPPVARALEAAGQMLTQRAAR